MCCARRLARLAFFVLTFAALCFVGGFGQAETLGRAGAGWLESIDGYLVLHLKGTPHEMGVQHGKLLANHVRENMKFLLETKANETVMEAGPVKVTPKTILPTIIQTQRPFVPEKYFEEMSGLAEGAGVKVEDVQQANFIPELFHCSGFALMNAATKDGTLYHGRVLDYGCDLRLQEHAVLIVQEPTGGIPFVNVSYAGFIGSVTGMNSQHVSIGEMGGKGLGQWQGTPMSLLVREVLESAQDLDAAVDVFQNHKRTCEYYYVIADAKSNRAVGIEATPEKLNTVDPGESHPRLAKPVKDTVLLSAGDRYEELVKRVQRDYGKFDVDSARHLMDRPVAMKSNLHNALFEPRSTRLWVANASPSGQPAAQQKYYAFQLSELLKRHPDGAGTVDGN
ncbi:MAG: C45 family peptidase [Pirellulales bacterium]